MPQVNSLPWREQRYKKAIRSFILLSLLYCLITFLILIGIYFNALEKNERLSEKLSIAQSINNEMKATLNNIQNVEQQLIEREEYLDKIVSMKRSTQSKYSLFLHVEQALSNGVWLKSIVIEQGKLVIEGYGTEYPYIVDFYKKIGSYSLISNLQLGSISVIESSLYSFSLIADWREVEA